MKNVGFCYIHTKENPADLPSRGLSSNDLKGNSLWWKGPEWLTHDQISWSTWNMPKIDKKARDKTQPEARRSKTLYEASAIAQEKQVFPKTASQAVKTDVTPLFEIKAENYSSLNKVLRITAYANCFIKNLKKITTPTGVPTANEIETANIPWIKYLQRKRYLDLSTGEMVLSKSIVRS